MPTIVGFIDEGVHHPEFDEFKVGSFKVRIAARTPLNTCPHFFRILESTVGVQHIGIRFIVVHTPLIGDIVQVKGAQQVVARDTRLVGEHLIRSYLTRIMIAQIRFRKLLVGTAIVKARVNRIPCKSATVEAFAQGSIPSRAGRKHVVVAVIAWEGGQ